MADFPQMPLWTDAYIGDTQHLTNEEHGIYLRLLMFAWRSPTCSLPNDDKRLAIMVGVTAGKWAKLKPTIMAFWDLDGDAWKQKKLTKERQYAEKKREQKRAAGKASAEAKSRKTKDRHPTDVATADATADQLPIPIPIPTVSEEGKPSSCQNDEIDAAFDAYAETASRQGWPQVQKRTKARTASLRARLKDAGGLEGWKAALDRAAASNHCNGQNERGWTANFDFLVRESSFTKLMEGNYDNRDRPYPPTPNGRGGDAHNSLMAGFAQAANRDPEGGETACATGFGPDAASEQEMGIWSGGDTPQPLFRVVGAK